MKKDNVNVIIRIDKKRIEKLKDIARERSYREKINITYNDLIVASVYREYFNGEDK
jgi:hypothetical protein